MSKKIVFFIAAGFFAILAVVATNIYLTQQSQEVKEKAKQEVVRQQAMQAAVVIARQDIPQGTLIEPGMVDTRVIVKDYVQPNAAQYPERIVGMKTLVPISQDEQITLNKLVSAKEVTAKSSLAMATPIGKRAISIPVDNFTSLMGLIKPGDYVDVLATVPIPAIGQDGKQAVQPAVVSLFQNVLVLTVNADMGGSQADAGRYQQASQSGQQQGPSLITLALTPQEANLLAFVQEQGRVRLSLRSPADSRIEPLQVANWENLFTYLLPPEMREKAMADQKKAATGEPAVEKPRFREIEIYRGLKKDSMPVSGQ